MSAVLGLVPARGGSRRLPGKNLAEIDGRSLLRITVETALASGRIDRLIVSTDDPAIAREAVLAGAEAPFLRPAHLSGDDAGSLDVARHALDWAEADQPGRFDLLVLLQPTSPLRRPADIAAAIDLCLKEGAGSAVSATPSAKPETLFVRDAQGRLSRIADMGQALALNGAVYAIRSDEIRRGKGFVNADTAVHVMAPEHSIDVDTADDLARARRLSVRS